jgi:hypothetical protein
MVICHSEEPNVNMLSARSSLAISQEPGRFRVRKFKFTFGNGGPVVRERNFKLGMSKRERG